MLNFNIVLKNGECIKCNIPEKCMSRKAYGEFFSQLLGGIEHCKLDKREYNIEGEGFKRSVDPNQIEKIEILM